MTTDYVALAKRAWAHFLGTLDGNAYDIQNADEDELQGRYSGFFDAFTDDVVWKVECAADTPAWGPQLHGKQAVIDLFTKENPGLIEGNHLAAPPKFVSAGNRVVMLGAESYRILKDGVTVAEVRDKKFAFVMDFRGELICRILLIEDLSEWNTAYRQPGWSSAVA